MHNDGRAQAVSASSRRSDRAAANLIAASAEVHTFVCDVADRTAVARLIGATLDRYGRLDILVNNAGVIQVGGKVAVPHLVPYSCAKFAAVAFSEGMRAELRERGILVTTIAPGLMRTGSHLSAHFKGETDREAALFGLAASLPLVSMDADRAARQIVAAAKSGRAERILTAQANLAARFHGLFPAATAEILAVVNRLLPHSSDSDQRVRGRDTAGLRHPLVAALTILGQRAAGRFLQTRSALIHIRWSTKSGTRFSRSQCRSGASTRRHRHHETKCRDESSRRFSPRLPVAESSGRLSSQQLGRQSRMEGRPCRWRRRR